MLRAQLQQLPDNTTLSCAFANLKLIDFIYPCVDQFDMLRLVRTQSENLLIGCALEDRTVGWGEGVPRSYVAGESMSGALQ